MTWSPGNGMDGGERRSDDEGQSESGPEMLEKIKQRLENDQKNQRAIEILAIVLIIAWVLSCISVPFILHSW